MDYQARIIALQEQLKKIQREKEEFEKQKQVVYDRIDNKPTPVQFKIKIPSLASILSVDIEERFREATKKWKDVIVVFGDGKIGKFYFVEQIHYEICDDTIKWKEDETYYLAYDFALKVGDEYYKIKVHWDITFMEVGPFCHVAHHVAGDKHIVTHCTFEKLVMSSDFPGKIFPA